MYNYTGLSEESLQFKVFLLEVASPGGSSV